MRPHARSIWRALSLAVCIGLAPSAWAGQVQYPALLVFGDSLSDTGNDFIATTPLMAPLGAPAIPPSVSPNATYWNGRFTNGPVAVEYLWQLMGSNPLAEVSPSLHPAVQTKPGVSFAFGGSASGLSNVTPSGFEVPGLLGQVGLFTQALGGTRARSDALYTVWSGSNDYLQNISGSPLKVVGNVALAIKGLYAVGARDFLVPNLPNLGRTPQIQAAGLGAQFTKLSRDHNALLDLTVTVLQRTLPNARFVKVDVYGLGESLLESGGVIADLPATEYLKPGSPAKDCLFLDPRNCIDVPLGTYLPTFLFWDVLHPTTHVHAAIGTTMYKALAKQR
jgi:phospholipase/lecithinase/hemolysin